MYYFLLKLYDDRREICLGNLRNPDGTVDQGWRVSLDMITSLGPAGMSSDESDWIDNQRVYRVRKRNWLSREVKEHLMVIDENRNRTNGYGGARAGNQPRHRIRASNAKTSKRDPTVGCPKNFYSKEYRAGRTNLEYRALRMTRNVDLGNAVTRS